MQPKINRVQMPDETQDETPSDYMLRGVALMPAARPKEHDVVALLVDLPDHSLAAGDTGAVVHCYDKADAFEVEFVDATGKPKAIVTVEAKHVLKLNWAAAAATAG